MCVRHNNDDVHGEEVRDMARGEWHKETFEEVISVLREHFVEAGFEVHVNRPVRTITIINRPRALTIMDTTDTHFDHENRLIFKD